MPDTNYEPLTQRERDSGIVLLTLISNWSAWANRRVETIEIYDEQTVRRRVSVDFELPDIPYIDTAPWDAGQPLYVVPLGQLRKRPLRHFDLRDEAGRSLPLMTSQKGSRLAAATLMAMAEAYGHGDEMLGPMPPAVARDLWRIARRPSEDAHTIWQRLGQAPTESTGPVEQSWRNSIASNEELMALAYDFSHSFLLLVPMAIRPRERRIATFGYDEPVLRPALARRRLSRSMRHQRDRRRAESDLDRSRRDAACEAGMGLVEISARTYSTSGESVLTEQRDLEVEVVWHHGGVPARETVRTNAVGKAILAVPAGSCMVVQRPPRGLLAVSPVSQRIAVRTGRTTPIDLRNRRIGTSGVEGESPRLTRAGRALRSLGLRPHKVALLVPAIGHAASYHVEAEAPEGLQLSGCRLEHRRSYATGEPHVAGDWRGDPAVRRVQEVRSLQRAHLHVSSVPQGVSALLTLRLRPRPTTVAQATFLASAITTILLGVVSLRFGAIGPNAGSVATLLLFGTAPLSAYVARPREHRMTSVLIRGTRMVALVVGCSGIAGSSLVLLQRDWNRTSAGTFSAQPDWGSASIVLLALAFVAFLCTVVAASGWHRAAAAERIVHEPSPPIVEDGPKPIRW